MKRGALVTALAALAIITAAPAVADPPARCSDTTRKNIPKGDPDYAPWLDKDGDGIACESH